MANLDTRSKRASGAQVLRSWGLALVAPDGTIAVADRQHIIWCYSGIAATSAVFPSWRVYPVAAEARELAIDSETRVVGVRQETRVYPVR